MKKLETPEEIAASINKATKRKTKWNSAHYDQIKVSLPKGYRDRLNQIAAEKGTSAAGLIKALIDENTPQ